MAEQRPKDTSGRQALPPYTRKSLKSGLINPGSVSENDMPDTAVLESVNFHFDIIGSARLRKGLTLLGTGLDASAVLGMHYHVDTVAGTHSQLLAVTGTVVYYLSAGTWTSKRTGLTTGKKTRFATFLDFVFMVNGADATAVWDGNPSNSFITTGNAASAPVGAFIENFRGRMWIAGNATYPDRLYYSSVPSAVTTPVVTWNTDVTTGQWLDISPSDGDTITALQRYRNVMIVFKTNHLYRVFDIGQTDPDPYYAVGTSSQESVVETKTGIFFHHSSGFYQYNVYGVVQEVSRPIWDIVRAIPASSYPNIVGWLEADQDHVVWFLGNVTVNGIAYTNLAVRYTISTQVWTHYTYGYSINTSIRRQPLYTDGTTQFAIVGDSLGNVFETNTGTTDNAKPIPFSLVHRWENVDGLLSTRKTVMTGNFSHYGAAPATVAYQTEDNDPDQLNDWTKRAGPLSIKNTGFNSMNIKARKFRFRLFGESSGQPFTYNGYELIGVQSEFIQFP